MSKDSPDIDELHVRPGGELWVLPSSGRMDDDPGALGVFDVFENAIDAARSGSGFIVLSDSDRKGDEAEEEIEPLSIVRYSMP